MEPSEALERLLERLTPVDAESVPACGDDLAGRVLAECVLLDRDSPACDVSAMDGYAVRLAELSAGPLPLAGECPIGEAPREVPAGRALRIFTGSPLPRRADTVIRLEAAEYSDGTIRLNGTRTPRVGDDIRRQGENAEAGAVVLESGMSISPSARGALATVGPTSIAVFRRLRVAIITTGNELVASASRAESLEPWRLRDSNGPALQAMLSRLSWIECVDCKHAPDSLEDLTERVRSALELADAVVLTGGVSKGDHDYVPAAVERAGAEPVFHRVRARPGQPTFGAVADGKPVLGLPGNPLSVLCTGRRLLVPTLRKRAGFQIADPAPTHVALGEVPEKRVPLTWWRPVRLAGAGQAELCKLRGSGDVIGPAGSDGFVEIPPDRDGAGPFAYYPWTV